MDDASQIAKLTDEVQILEKRLKDSTAELQDILFTISHDFKGPMRAIMSSSMILLEDYAPALDSVAKDELKRQSGAARKMNKMLEELLKLSRLSRREVIKEDLDLGEMILTVAPKCGLRPSALTVEGEVCGLGDRGLVSLLLMFLLENSVKFADPERPLALTFAKNGSFFFLKDSGIGFLPEQGARVFQPFERLNGDSYPGMGTGLTQAKRIVAMHDGEIFAEGVLGEGCTIRFSLGA